MLGDVEVSMLKEYTNRLQEQIDLHDDLPISTESFRDIGNQIQSMHFNESTMDSAYWKKFLKTLYVIASLVDLEDENGFYVALKNISMLIVDFESDGMVRGLQKINEDAKECEVPNKSDFLFEDGSDLDREDHNSKNFEFLPFTAVEGRTLILVIVMDERMNDGKVKCNYRVNVHWDDSSTEMIDNYFEDYETSNMVDESVNQVLNELEVLLQNETINMATDEMNHVFDQVDNLLDAEDDTRIPGEFLQMLDQLGARVQLDDVPMGAAVRHNVALLTADSTPQNPVRGLRIAARDVDVFSEDSFEFISGEDVDSTSVSTNETDALVLLPDSIVSSSRRISFVVFRNDRAFHHDQDYVVNSRIFSINVENFTVFENGETFDILLSPLNKKLRRNESRACAYWKYQENGTGSWARDGCTYIRSSIEGALDICRCDHLTHFAEVIITKDVFSELHESILQILSVIGCSFSVFGITVIALTALLFRTWRQNGSNKIWLQLCLAVFILDICFLITVFVQLNQYDIYCEVIGIVLHYSVLATFLWMLVISILSYRKLVFVFTRDIRKKVLVTSSFSWGIPFLVISILLTIDPNSYSRKFEEKTPNGGFCYPTGLALFLTLLAPITLIWFVNWSLYALTIRSMFVNKQIRRHSISKEYLQSASASCLLAFLCGIPWVFGFFSFNIVAAYLFTLTVTFQGFILFCFFILGNRKTRKLWIKMFESKFMRREVVSPISSSVGSRFYVPRPTTSSQDETSSTLLSESKL